MVSLSRAARSPSAEGQGTKARKSRLFSLRPWHALRPRETFFGPHFGTFNAQSPCRATLKGNDSGTLVGGRHAWSLQA